MIRSISLVCAKRTGRKFILLPSRLILSPYIMASITVANSDEHFAELADEFAKLIALIPTIPKDQALTELELIELVIAYIRQLQQLVSLDQWNDCLNQLSQTMKTTLLTSSPPSSANVINQILLGSNHRSPLATIHLDNAH